MNYIVCDGEAVIVDEFTGRDGRRWSDGQHQAIEAKESLSIRLNPTLASITYKTSFCCIRVWRG